MKSYKSPVFVKTGLKRNESIEGETIEQKLERKLTNKEPIEAIGTRAIYTERKDGVQAAYNIRTDRWEVALDGIDKINKSRAARRDAKPDGKVIDLHEKGNGGAEPTQGDVTKP